MEFLKKLFIVVLGFLTLNLYLPGAAFADSGRYHVSAGITVHPLEIRSTPELDLPKKTAEDNRSWISRHKWWVVGGLAVVAAAAGGGGGGGGGSDPPPQPNNGSYDFSW